MNCVITIAGNGSGRHGNPKKPRTGPVREFLVDNIVFYIAVTNHLKTCNICNIEDIVRVYLERRKLEKFSGMTSNGLVKRVIILEKLAAKKGKPIPKELVNEFLWRSGPHFTTYFGDKLSPREKILGYKVLFAIPGFGSPIPGTSDADRTLARIAQDSSGKEFTDEEIESLVRVAEIIYA